MPHINWLAAIVAGLVSGLGIGFLWYGPLFGKAWMAETGISKETPSGRSMGLMMGGTLVLAVLGAIAFAFFLGPKVTAQEGATYGFVAGLFWIAGSLGINYLWEGKSLRLWAINGSYFVAQYTLIGLILGLWH
jgi:hypothetical protein